ncbi:MAG: gamma-glutamyltransferase family protein [Candidatus Methylomirabilota bacterium]
MIRSAFAVAKTMPRVRRGLVVAEHPLGAEVGASILERGGNAVDAAVATAFAMTVIEPFMSTVAGGGSFLVHLAKRGETVAIDANVEAPAACHERCFTLADGIVQSLFTWRAVAGDANIHGPKSVAVPGSVAGLCLLLERYGRMELADVLAPAIRLAEEGVVPDWYLGLTMAIHAEEIRRYPDTARAYLRNGTEIYRPPFLAEGDLLRQPDLGRSLRLLAAQGPAALYRGELGERIVECVQRGGGWLTREDLARYAPEILPPLVGRYRQVELAFTPGATGGITALEILRILAEFPPDRVGYDTPGGLHRRAEAVRWAFLDRLRWLADPRQVKAPWEGLLSPRYAAALAKQLRGKQLRREQPDEDPWRHGSDPADEEAAGPTRPAPARPADQGTGDCTTHIAVVDRERNMVSLTNTAVSLFGSRLVVPGTGILLANGMIWFDPEPGRPNSVAAGKRPLVNMVPVLGFRRGEPYFAMGAPGGRKIVSAIPQVLSNLIDLKDAPQAAMAAPRLHTEGGALWVDDRVGSAALAALRRMGHPVVPRAVSFSTLFFSRPVAIRVTRQGLEAGLDPFSDASAAGF